MVLGLALAAFVMVVLVAELARTLVARLVRFEPERHTTRCMRLVRVGGPRGRRLTLLAAGPIAGYLAIGALAFAHLETHGFYHADRLTRVTETLAGHDAVNKLAIGDILVAVDGRELSGGAQVLSQVVQHRHGAPVTLTIERAGVRRDVTVEPTATGGRYVLGIRFGPPRPESTGDALRQALAYPMRQARAIATSLPFLATGDADLDAGGPVQLLGVYRRELSSSSELVTGYLMLFGTYALVVLALFDLVRALLIARR